MITSCTTQSYLKHLVNPFCSIHPNQARLSKIFYTFVVFAVAGYTIQYLLSERAVTSKPSPKDNPMAEVLESQEQIKTLTGMYGVSIETIEHRARPHCDSIRGFLSTWGTLKGSLSESWGWATQLGVTHIQIADCLDQLCTKYKEAIDCSRFQENLNLALCFPQLKNIPEMTTASISVYQSSTTMRIRDTDIFRPPNTVSENNSYVEIVIQNLQTNKTVIWTPVRGQYIRKYGFYSRGIEFADLMEVLTGKHIQELLSGRQRTK